MYCHLLKQIYTGIYIGIYMRVDALSLRKVEEKFNNV